MENNVLATDYTTHERCITHVAAYFCYLGLQAAREYIQPTIGIERVVHGERRDLGLLSSQRLRQVGANETIRARD
jgi:hypothetical protein